MFLAKKQKQKDKNWKINYTTLYHNKNFENQIFKIDRYER